MALNLASPGIVVREVDLTIGRVDATSGSIGALVAPFTKGPVGTHNSLRVRRIYYKLLDNHIL